MGRGFARNEARSMILVDSSVWIDFFNGVDKPHVEKLYQLLGKEIIVTGDLIVVEVLQGFNLDIHFDLAKEVLERLTFFLYVINLSRSQRLIIFGFYVKRELP